MKHTRFIFIGLLTNWHALNTIYIHLENGSFNEKWRANDDQWPLGHMVWMRECVRCVVCLCISIWNVWNETSHGPNYSMKKKKKLQSRWHLPLNPVYEICSWRTNYSVCWWRYSWFPKFAALFCHRVQILTNIRPLLLSTIYLLAFYLNRLLLNVYIYFMYIRIFAVLNLAYLIFGIVNDWQQKLSLKINKTFIELNWIRHSGDLWYKENRTRIKLISLFEQHSWLFLSISLILFLSFFSHKNVAFLTHLACCFAFSLGCILLFFFFLF